MGHEIRDLGRSISLDSAGNDFIKLAKCLGVASLGGQTERGRKLAAEFGSGRVREVMSGAVSTTKGAVSIAALSDALAPYKILAEGFLASMAEFSALSRINNAGDWYAVPPRTLVSVLTTALVGDSAAELFAKAFSSGTFNSQKLEPQKTVSQIALSNDLARSLSQAAILQLGREMRRAAAIKADAQLLATLCATSAANTGVSAAAILADLIARLQAMTIGADSRLWFICSPKLFKNLALIQGSGGFLMVGNKIGPVSIAPSDAATTTAFLIDARQVCVGMDDPPAVIVASQEASVQMDDNPTSTAYQLFSAFQNNATIYQTEIWFACLAARGSAIGMLTGYS
jgi:hypothetical protein